MGRAGAEDRVSEIRRDSLREGGPSPSSFVDDRAFSPPFTMREAEECVEARKASAMFAVFGRGSQESVSSTAPLTPAPLCDNMAMEFPPLPQRPRAGSAGSRETRQLPRVVENWP